MNKILIVIASLIVLGAAGYFLFKPAPKQSEPVTSNEMVESTPTESVMKEDSMMEDTKTGTDEAEVMGSQKDVYTLEEVAKHDNKNDCWMVIDGKVYDVTEFISAHPGGSAILQGCGTDATQLYETRPMGSGTPHSQRARDLSESYLIGELEK